MNEIFANNPTIQDEINKIQTGTLYRRGDFRSYLDDVGSGVMKERLNLTNAIGSKFSKDELDTHLYNELIDYSNEKPTIEAENQAGYKSSTYGKIRLNLATHGLKTGKPVKNYRHYNYYFKRGKIDQYEGEPIKIRDEARIRLERVKKYIHNNSDLTPQSGVSKVDIRKYDDRVIKMYRSIVRDDDDIAGFAVKLNRKYKSINKNNVKAEVAPQFDNTNLNRKVASQLYKIYQDRLIDGVKDSYENATTNQRHFANTTISMLTYLTERLEI